jgi:hypothetical protein
MTVAQRLRQRRHQIAEARGLSEPYSQAAIAKVARCSQPNYCLCEADGPRNRRLAPWRMQRIAEFYGMTLTDCFPEYKLTAREREQLDGALAVLSETNVVV